MIVALDMQLDVGTSTGIGEYVRGLASGLRAREIDVRELRLPALDPWRFDRRIVWDQIGLPLAARRSGAQVLHCTAGTMPLVLTLPAVTTVHDVAWLRAQGHARAYSRWYFGSFSLRQYPRARRLVVDSEFSRTELLHFLNVPPARVSVVHPGVASDYCSLVRTVDPSPFLLSVGTVERRKNLAVVIRALGRLPAEVRLVVAGPSTPYEDECRALAAQLGVDGRIDWLGYVTRAELLSLFARAAAVVVPSTYEGFGYAAAQALCAGVPVAVSDCTSLPEVVADDADPLPPGDPDAWSTQLLAIVSERAQAQARSDRLRPGAIARFAWHASVAKMCEVYEAALEG